MTTPPPVTPAKAGAQASMGDAPVSALPTNMDPSLRWGDCEEEQTSQIIGERRAISPP